MGSATPITHGVQYYWIYEDQLSELNAYTGGNHLANDFKYYFPGDNGSRKKVYAIITDIMDDEEEFLLMNNICNVEWFRYSNQPTILTP